MKKILVILFTLAMLTACGSKPNTDTANETFKDELIAENTVIIGTSPDYPPYESLDSSTKELVGFDIDLMNAIVAKLGEEYKVEWRQMEFDTIISSVQTKQIDLGVSGFSYDPEKQVLFSDPYHHAGQTVLVKKDSNIHSAQDLNGKLIAAQIGTTCLDLAKTIEGAEVATATDAKVLVEALKTGAYDGVVLDTTVANSYVLNNSELAVLDEELASDEYCIISTKDNDKLIAKLNEILAEFVQSEEYNALLEKWGI